MGRGLYKIKTACQKRQAEILTTYFFQNLICKEDKYIIKSKIIHVMEKKIKM
jgi:hypothetical protein